MSRGPSRFPDHLQVAGQFFDPSTVNELSVCCQLRVMIRTSVTLLQAFMVDVLVELLQALGIEQELGYGETAGV